MSEEMQKQLAELYGCVPIAAPDDWSAPIDPITDLMRAAAELRTGSKPAPVCLSGAQAEQLLTLAEETRSFDHDELRALAQRLASGGRCSRPGAEAAMMCRVGTTTDDRAVVAGMRRGRAIAKVSSSHRTDAGSPAQRDSAWCRSRLTKEAQPTGNVSRRTGEARRTAAAARDRFRWLTRGWHRGQLRRELRWQRWWLVAMRIAARRRAHGGR